jgi:hypothetical protein
MYPKILRPLVHWFIPECRLLRRQYAEARSVIQPVINERKKEKSQAVAQGRWRKGGGGRAAAEGRPVPTFDDDIEWAEEESKRAKYDPATYQLALSGAAIHTTTDLLSQTILNLVTHKELIQPLRDEVAESLRTHGWSKAGLNNLKLMDSIIKKTQLMKPIQIGK